MNGTIGDFRRDPTTGALIFSDQSKRQDILDRRNMLRELKELRNELNNLKKIVEQLAAKSN